MTIKIRYPCTVPIVRGHPESIFNNVKINGNNEFSMNPTIARYVNTLLRLSSGTAANKGKDKYTENRTGKYQYTPSIPFPYINDLMIILREISEVLIVFKAKV